MDKQVLLEAIEELKLQKDNSYEREVTDETCDVAIEAIKLQLKMEEQNG